MSKTILCFGDSNTWGFIPGTEGDRYEQDVRWPGVMKSELGDGFTIIEEAQNGRMTAWGDPFETSVSKCGLDHLPVVLESQKPLDLVIIMLGTNDLKNHMNHSATTIAHAVATLVDVVKESDSGPQKSAPEVLMICPAAVSKGHCPFWHLFDGASQKSREMPVAYREMAEDRDVPFLNSGEFATCSPLDCIHLNDEGHAALGKAVAAKVSEIFG